MTLEDKIENAIGWRARSGGHGYCDHFYYKNLDTGEAVSACGQVYVDFDDLKPSLISKNTIHQYGCSNCARSELAFHFEINPHKLEKPRVEATPHAVAHLSKKEWIENAIRMVQDRMIALDDETSLLQDKLDTIGNEYVMLEDFLTQLKDLR